MAIKPLISFQIPNYVKKGTEVPHAMKALQDVEMQDEPSARTGSDLASPFHNGSLNLPRR